jgi:hypothetical protein
MQKKSSRRQHSKKKTARTKTVTIPPAALAVVRLAGVHGNVNKFAEAYSQMPLVVETILDNAELGLHRVDSTSVIKDLVDADIASERFGFLADAFKLLDDENPDIRTDVEMSLGEAGFYTGMAFATYMLLHRETVTLPRKH